MRRTWIQLMDALVIIWVVGWCLAGIHVARQLGELSQLGRTADQAATALDRTAEGMRTLDEVPFVGDEVGRVAGEVERTAAETRVSAARSHVAVDDVAPIVGAAVAVGVSVPTLLAYLPLRLARVGARRPVAGNDEPEPEPAGAEPPGWEPLHAR